MTDVRKIAEEIIDREGGFVNDPDDPGGATNFGITIGTMRRLGIDMDGDSDIDIADVRKLDRATATRIILRHYFEAPGISRLPEVIQASVFDMYVNAGAHAVKILQRLINQMRIDVKVDGVIGPLTAAAAQQAFAAAPDHLVDAYGIARRNYYYALADTRPASRRYALRQDGGKGGWILRAEEFIAARFHLTDAAHSQRVAAWA